MGINCETKGCLRQLWLIAIPLIISSLSGMAMLFVDRLVLARYTLKPIMPQLKQLIWAGPFLSGWGALASVTQIFVAQNNGAGKHHLLGQPVWQMIWLGIVSILFFFPMAIWGSFIFFGADASHEMQRTYFFWMLLFGPAHILFSALSGFFIGQGKTFLTGSVVFIGNIINTFLCCLLVFGWEGYFPSWGIQGAAIATNTAVAGQVLILAVAFFRRSNRQKYGTSEWKWNPTLLMKCIKVGLPGSLFGILEVAGWVVFYKMMSSLGENHLTVAGIVQNILILFNFFGEGLSRGVATLSGNAIGANRPGLVYKYVRCGFLLMTFFTIGFALLIWYLYPVIIDWFLDSPSKQNTLLYSALIFGLGNAVIYKYLEGIRLILGGALSAAADTFFLLIGGAAPFGFLWFYRFMLWWF